VVFLGAERLAAASGNATPGFGEVVVNDRVSVAKDLCEFSPSAAGTRSGEHATDGRTVCFNKRGKSPLILAVAATLVVAS
jgi:hypothetical protein